MLLSSELLLWKWPCLFWETTNEVGDGVKSGDLLLLLMTEELSIFPRELVLITVSSAQQRALS